MAESRGSSALSQGYVRTDLQLLARDGRNCPSVVGVADNELVSCSICGRRRDLAAAPAEALTWVSERERGGQRWLCPGCARAHVRDIEGKLPAEYW
ncbi:hypothetical protein BCF44_117226 [Kutzneria buriramensis]|uniref:Uncharacterized protein n=1 Tax=Kutzneria buriramensis TaxID=1045776 RepID=A0A3E0GZR6_9PSEU|nr:hypothetical protein BCF44_117226 [Kutzneria buriramensis]